VEGKEKLYVKGTQLQVYMVDNPKDPICNMKSIVKIVNSKSVDFRDF
jgi:hypothetical protein